jgi:hypothetical protein
MAYIKPSEQDLDDTRATLHAIAQVHHAFGPGHIIPQDDGTAFEVPDDLYELYVKQMGFPDAESEQPADEETGPAGEPADEPAEAPKRRGRPKGSTNKPKTEDEPEGDA